jgi:hypothetical protein
MSSIDRDKDPGIPKHCVSTDLPSPPATNNYINVNEPLIRMPKSLSMINATDGVLRENNFGSERASPIPISPSPLSIKPSIQEPEFEPEDVRKQIDPKQDISMASGLPQTKHVDECEISRIKMYSGNTSMTLDQVIKEALAKTPLKVQLKILSSKMPRTSLKASSIKLINKPSNVDA